MELQLLLKSIADDTRFKIIKLLLKHNYCVKALANELSISEAGVSQHLKVLREAGLLIGEKKGYFMHYDVDREKLHELAISIGKLASIEREICTKEKGNCRILEFNTCNKSKYGSCSKEVKEFCHGNEG